MNGNEKHQFKSLQIPILVIGTKADLVDDVQRIKQSSRSGNIGKRPLCPAALLNAKDRPEEN